MDLLRWMGSTFARFVAFVVMILGIWTFVRNVTGANYEGLVLVWVIASSFAGGAGGLLYLLSWDGPQRFRSQPIRLGGWLAMLASALLPTTLTLMILPMVIVVCPLLPYARVTSQ